MIHFVDWQENPRIIITCSRRISRRGSVICCSPVPLCLCRRLVLTIRYRYNGRWRRCVVNSYRLLSVVLAAVATTSCGSRVRCSLVVVSLRHSVSLCHNSCRWVMMTTVVTDRQMIINSTCNHVLQRLLLGHSNCRRHCNS